MLRALVSTWPDVPDVDFVVNFGDGAKTIPLPAGAPADLAKPSGGGDAFDAVLREARAPGCADFSYERLRRAPEGPFGPVHGGDNGLWRNDFSNRSAPIFSAVGCCYARDVSFPVAWCDLSQCSLSCSLACLLTYSRARFPAGTTLRPRTRRGAR